MRPPASPRAEPRRSFDGALIAALALAASVAGVMNDFVYDDIPLVRDNVRVHGLGSVWEIFTRPYWPPPFVEQLYRPLSLMLLAVQYSLGGGSPIIVRLASYALYAGCAVAVFRLASAVLPRWFAFGAAALFAVHPVHVEAVALGVNQGEIIVALIATVMTLRYLARRRAGELRQRDWLLLSALYALATLTKESGYVLPALLLSAELFLIDDRTASARVRGLWKGFALLAGVGASMLAVRAAVLGEQFASVPAASIAGLGIADRMYVMLQVVPMWLRLLVWPAHLQADFAPNEIARPATFGIPEALGVLIILATVATIVGARRRAPVVSFGLAWCAIALLPVSNIVPTGIILAERTLFVPSIGFVIAVGAASAELAHRARSNERSVHRALAGLCAVLLLLGILRSAGRHRVWNTAHLEIVNRPTSRR